MTTITPAYIPVASQTDQQAQARATQLGVGVAPRDVPPVYAPHLGALPGVVAEYGGANVVWLHDDGTLTAAQVQAAIAPLVAQQQADAATATNGQTLRDRATQALTANATFLAAAKPATAAAQASQAYDQTVRLTRECSALIRLFLGALEDVAGT